MTDEIIVPKGYFRFRVIDENGTLTGHATLPMWEKPRICVQTTEDDIEVVRISVGRNEVYWTDEPEEIILEKMAHAQQQ